MEGWTRTRKSSCRNPEIRSWNKGEAVEMEELIQDIKKRQFAEFSNQWMCLCGGEGWW